MKKGYTRIGYAVMVSGGSVTVLCCDNQYAEDRQ